MNISKISANNALGFKAQTKINAPEDLLSKKDRAYFEELGKKYKTPNDTIEINISNLHSIDDKPNVQLYTVSKTIRTNSANGNSLDQSKMTIPYVKDGVTIEKNSPKNYLSKVFSSLLSR